MQTTTPVPAQTAEHTPTQPAPPIGYPLEIVRETLIAHFNLDEIRTICQDIEVDFEQLGGDGTLSAKARSLIEYLQKRETLALLIHEIEEERPGKLAKAASSQAASSQNTVINTEPVQHATQKIEAGLVALTQSVQIPEVHRAILFFQADFILAQKQISRLHHLKKLQELFRDLQEQFNTLEAQASTATNAQAASQGYWGRLVTDARAFDTGSGDSDLGIAEKVGRENLIQAITRTISYVDELLTTTPRSAGKAGDTLWADKLDEARRDLDTVLTDFNKQLLDDAIEWIAHVLKHEPGRINDRIVGTVEVLLASQMTLRMSAVHEKLLALNVTPSITESFAGLVSNLPQLNDTLHALVAGHYGWQAIYLEIEHILSDPEAGLDELSQEWRTVTMTIQRLVGQGNTEPWVSEFNTIAREVEQAFTAQKVDDVRMRLSLYRDKAYARFRMVDESLVKFCGDLQGIGEKLNVLLGGLAQPVA